MALGLASLGLWVHGGSPNRSLVPITRFAAAGVAATGVFCLVAPVDGAGAATQIGQTFQPTSNCSPRTRLQTGSPNGQYAAPFPGVITSWSEQSSSAGGESPVVFKVARSAGGDAFTVVGESEGRLIPDADTLSTFPVRIAVQTGDVIGLFSAPASVFLCSRAATGYTVGESAFGTEVTAGTMAAFTPVPNLQLGVSATLEADCDSDGFGDETQDPDTATCKDSKFSFGKLKRNKKRGTAKLTVKVPGPGTLTLLGKGLVRQRPGTLPAQRVGAHQDGRRGRRGEAEDQAEGPQEGEAGCDRQAQGQGEDHIHADRRASEHQDQADQACRAEAISISAAPESDGATRVMYILGVPLAESVERQWPQMNEVVRSSKLVADVEGNFPELTLEVGRRLQLEDVIVVEWTCDYGDGRLYRNVTIGELEDGKAVRVTDYWGEPTETPEWRRSMTDRLDMPGDGIWPDSEHLAHY